MALALKPLTNNPTLTIGGATLLAALVLSVSSLGILLNALVFEPQIEIRRANTQNTATAANAIEISERNFFGIADATPEIDLTLLPETTLELKLQGAFTATENAAAGAIILDDKNIAQIYHIGESLPGNATLESIHSDRVVLKRLGAYETLYFDDPDEEKPGVDTRSVTSKAPNAGYSSPQEDAAAQQRRDAIRARIKQLRGR